MKKYVAEMIGTMVLVLMGCGSAVIAGAEIGFLGIAFAFGLSVVARRMLLVVFPDVILIRPLH